MPLQKLQFRPGVNKEGTTLANEGGWFDCDKVRFRSGYPEKLGGWTAFSTNRFVGVCRSLWNWVTLKGSNLLGVGTNLKFYIEDGGAYYDVTPLRETTTNPSGQITLSVTSGSNVLTVRDINADSLQVNDFVTLAGATNLGTAGTNVTAAILNQEYQIASVISGISYTITLPVTANQTASSSAMIDLTIAYQINTGNAIYTTGNGWGTGPWPPYVSTTLTNPFTASGIGVSTLNVLQPAHGLSTGDYVYFQSIASNPCGINRVVLQKGFQVTRVDNNNYTISTVIGEPPGPVFTYTTTSTAASGGAVVVSYPQAGNSASDDRAWGAAFTTGIGQQLRLWSQTNYGESLLFSYRGGPIYFWSPGNAAQPDFTVRAKLVGGVDIPAVECPTQVLQLLISDATRIVIAFGCNPYSFDPDPDVIDPLLVRWSVAENFTEWNPSVTNQAGSYRLSHGSSIVGALQTRQENLIWTDSSVYSMQYAGPPYIWSFNILADNISIASPNAAATVNGVVYWMGTDKFYVYSGRVETLPSALRQFVFSDINLSQLTQVVAGTNEGYNEVWWHYCSTESEINDRYVIYNHLDKVWYYGSLSRTAWLDSALRDYPMAADPAIDGIVYHELGVDNNSDLQTPAPIYSYIQSSDFDIGDGHNYGFVYRIIPDLTFNGSNPPPGTKPQVTFTVRPRQNPGSVYGTADNPTISTNQDYSGIVQTYPVQQFTQIVYTRIRGRQMAFKLESNDLGTQWQLGNPRIDVRSDGRR